MSRRVSVPKLCAGVAALSLCVASPAAAAASNHAQANLSPWVALSAFASSGSSAALCAGAASAAASSAAQGAAPGCVLPVVDAPPPIAETPAPEALAPAVAPVAASQGIGALPILLGLAALAGLAAILLASDDDGDDEIAISPG